MQEQQYRARGITSKRIAIGVQVFLFFLMLGIGYSAIALPHGLWMLAIALLAMLPIALAVTYNDRNWQALNTKYKIVTAIFLMLAVSMLLAAPILLTLIPTLPMVFLVLLVVVGALSFCFTLVTHYRQLSGKSGHEALQALPYLMALLTLSAFVIIGCSMLLGNLAPSALNVAMLVCTGVVGIALLTTLFFTLDLFLGAEWEELDFGYKLAAAVAITLGTLAVLTASLLLVPTFSNASLVVSPLLITLLFGIGTSLVVVTTILHGIHITRPSRPLSPDNPNLQAPPAAIAIPAASSAQFQPTVTVASTSSADYQDPLLSTAYPASSARGSRGQTQQSAAVSNLQPLLNATDRDEADNTVLATA